jgi:hypothetical protein
MGFASNLYLITVEAANDRLIRSRRLQPDQGNPGAIKTDRVSKYSRRSEILLPGIGPSVGLKALGIINISR